MIFGNLIIIFSKGEIVKWRSDVLGDFHSAIRNSEEVVWNKMTVIHSWSQKYLRSYTLSYNSRP